MLFSPILVVLIALSALSLNLTNMYTYTKWLNLIHHSSSVIKRCV